MSAKNSFGRFVKIMPKYLLDKRSRIMINYPRICLIVSKDDAFEAVDLCR